MDTKLNESERLEGLVGQEGGKEGGGGASLAKRLWVVAREAACSSGATPPKGKYERQNSYEQWDDKEHWDNNVK